MSEEVTTFDPVEYRRAWLQKLLDEFLKLESQMPVKNFLPDDDGPVWVKNLEREIAAIMFPVAKLKDNLELTPKRVGGIIGHQCAIGVWMMEWFEAQLRNPQEPKNMELTDAQIEAAVKFLKGLVLDWYGALRRLAKRALCSCVDQSYNDMTTFLSAYAEAFAHKPSGTGSGNVGHSAFEIYIVMLTRWRLVEQLGSVSALHEFLVKVFGSYRVGELKRIEKICQRICLRYRKPGRPKKAK